MRFVVVAVAALCVLAGCAAYEAKPLSPEQTAAQFEARSLDDPGLKKFLEQNRRREIPNWPLQTWDFETLTLAALYYHPSLDVARARWAVARAGIQTAGQRPNPAASLSPQYASNSPSGESPWVAALSFDGVLETAGKRRYRTEEATQLSEAARLNLAVQAWQVRSHLRTSLLDYTAARQRVALLENVQDAQQQVLQLLEGRLAAGDIAASELTTQRVALIRTQADLADARRQVVESRTAVAQALGLPVQALEGRELGMADFGLQTGDSTPGTNPPSTIRNHVTPDSDPGLRSAEARSRALHSRADILAALADYAASQSALQLEIARQYPDLRLGPGYEFDQGLHKWGLAAGTDFLPVFNRNQGPIAEAEAKRAEAAARFLALQAQVIGEIDQALAGVGAAREQLRQIDALIEAQRKNVRAVEARVKAGAADQFELRAAQLEVATTELARLDALVKGQQALGRLEDAVQVPFEALSSVEQNPRAAVMEASQS